MTKENSSLIGSLLTALFFTVFSSALCAQAWPAKPVRWIVANAPSSSPDIVARMTAERLTKVMGQSFFVENRPGAEGVPAAEAVARAAPDGYTLFQGGNNTLASNIYLLKSMPYDPSRDFAPIAMLVDSAPFVLAVNPSIGVNTMPELAAMARSQPGKLSYAVSASLGPILGSWLMKVAGIDMVQVPYKETMRSAQDTMTNLTQMVVIAYPSIESIVKAGRLKVIAVTSGRRFPGLDDIPALAEHYSGFQVAGWFCLVGPRGLPDGVVQRLNREIDIFIKEPETQRRMTSFGFLAAGAQTPQAINAFVAGERERWKRIVSEVGLKPQ